MLIVIEALLSKDEITDARQQLLGARWVDGKSTAGTQSAAVKTNRQLAENSPLAQQLGRINFAPPGPTRSFIRRYSR